MLCMLSTKSLLLATCRRQPTTWRHLQTIVRSIHYSAPASRGFDWTANAGRHNRENALRVHKEKATERGSFTFTKYAARDAGDAFNEHRDGQAPRKRHDEDQSNAGLSDWNQEPNSAPRGNALMSFYNEIAWSTRSSKRGVNSKTEKGKPEEVKGALDDDHDASMLTRNHTGEDPRPSFQEETKWKRQHSTCSNCK